jgi:FlaA1/EpsC-like NDP-sugar epimerase
MTNRTRFLKKTFLIVIATDILLLFASWYIAYLFRFNFNIPVESRLVLYSVFPVVALTKVITFYFFDLYQGMWRYTSLDDLINIIKASTVSTLVVVALILFFHGFTGFPRSVIILDWIFTNLFISSARVAIRLYFWIARSDKFARFSPRAVLRFRRPAKPGTKNLLIIGAGDCGEAIFREIRDNVRLRYKVVGFVDDDPVKLGKRIHGIQVQGEISRLKTIADRVKADEALIAIPSATTDEMRAIVVSCEKSGMPFKIVPSMGELINGKVTINAIREVDYRDLLNREVIRLEQDRIGSYLENARVLVTGAGGSIGSELCRQICRFRPGTLVLYERAESPLCEMEWELKDNFPHVQIVAQLADVRDRNQISRTFSAFRPQVVFHAAAYKHVPILELQPWKAIKNNILGTRNLVDMSREYGVDRFVFVSTDKAVRPCNVMGASKRVAELIVQGQNGCGPKGPRFMIVRFGNVVGSAGSVVPLFKRQIEKGGPVTVTHPDITRYFMTIPEACQLILQAGGMGEGGEIFILDMGKPVKISDMARDFIRFSGFEPDVDIEVKYIGLRPGEKLHEELITEGEGIVPTGHKKIMVLRGRLCDQVHLNGEVDELARLARDQEAETIRLKLREIVPEFSIEGNISSN